jgi:hypothetical protein
MNKGCKITLIVISIIFAIILIGGYFALKTLRGAFGSECELTKEWTFQEYQIKEYRCIGWAGPPWYPMDIHKNGKEIATNVIRQDSCVIRFRKNKEQYVDLNICENSVTKIEATKTLLNLKNIDSIQMYSKKDNLTKKLNETQTRKILIDWNNSEISDYRDEPFDSIYYPDYSYKLFIFQNGILAEYITGNYLMAGKNKWTHIMSKKRDIEYFNKIWNE